MMHWYSWCFLLLSWPSVSFIHRPTTQCRRRNHELSMINTQTKLDESNYYTSDLVGTVQVFPAKTPLSDLSSDQDFSILSWNILLPNSDDNWWNHKMYAPNTPMEKRKWSHRKTLIKERLLNADADIICIQEASGDTFHEDFGFLRDAGYGHVLHKKFRFRCVTFFKEAKFMLDQEAHKDRTLVTALKSRDGKRILNIVNCHLSGGAAPDRRLRQVHEGLDQIRKWKNKAQQMLQKQRKANRPNPKNIEKAEAVCKLIGSAGSIVCGDFNSDGNTAVRRLLIHGSVNSTWREPQYPNIQLTSSKPRKQDCPYLDAAELAYESNVCDGDYGEKYHNIGGRPATYVVPNLASLLLLPISGEGAPRTEFGYQMARGIADTLGMKNFNEEEIDQAFDSIDLDGDNVINEDEVQQLLETVYVKAYGMEDIETQRKKFLGGQAGSLTREQLKQKLINLQQQLAEDEVGSKSHSVTRAIMSSLGLNKFSEAEIDQAFDRLDVDGNNIIDEDEVQQLLESVYVNTYGRHEIEKERTKFFQGYQSLPTSTLSRNQLKQKLMDLQQQLEGGNQGVELVEVQTRTDATRMIDRFSPALREALDLVFLSFSGDGEYLTQEEVAKFLIKTNGQLGRGGMWRWTEAMFERNDAARLSHEDWYEAFARELGEGKWWQVVYDLELCGANLRSNSVGQHYQGWLDYVFFDSSQLECKGIQNALSTSEVSLVYDQGDALPNQWHPSDHLPVAGVFSWQD